MKRSAAAFYSERASEQADLQAAIPTVDELLVKTSNAKIEKKYDDGSIMMKSLYFEATCGTTANAGHYGSLPYSTPEENA